MQLTQEPFPHLRLQLISASLQLASKWTEALVAKREALSLTVAEMAILLNVSPLTLRRWEAQEAFPRKMHHERIHAVLALGKRQAKRLLTEGESPE